MRFETLSEWLNWQETLHPTEIELDLERVRQVQKSMGLLTPSFTVISVAGTNGKGSCVAMLAAIYRGAGYRVGAYTSPHLLKYNERICIDGEPVTDQELCSAFERVDQNRKDTSLTYFEFGTLAALQVFTERDVQVAILEVGLGGRLDAVNCVDADVALITIIVMDHMQWLNDSRDAIGQEKTGIMRSGKPIVYAEPNPPPSVPAYAGQLGARLYRLGEDYSYRATGAT